MSFSEQLGTAIAAVKTYAQIDALNREIIVAWGDGLLDDAVLQAATEALQARKRSLRDNPRPPSRKPLCGLRRPPRPRSPDRQASIRRRRREIAPSSIPPQIAENFTPGELSALAVIARIIARDGQCAEPIDKIAAIAGVCARVVQKAQRLAEYLGFLSIEARPQPGKKSLPNVIRITSAEWASWFGLQRVNENASHGKRINNQININLRKFGRALPSMARQLQEGLGEGLKPITRAIPSPPRARPAHGARS